MKRCIHLDLNRFKSPLINIALICGFLFLGSLASAAIDIKLTAEEKEQYKVIDKAIDLFKSNKKEAALEKLNEWNPKLPELSVYKKYWDSIWSQEPQKLWNVFYDLKKRKQFVRLRLEVLRIIFDLNRAEDVDAIKKEARVMLKYLRGTSEGELFETQYLKWIQKNKFYSEVCLVERKRWIGQPDMDFIEVVAGVHGCPMKIDDFLMRMRRLLFASKEFQAEREVDMFLNNEERPLKNWEKAYVRAIFSSNRGEPDVAYKNLKPFEKEILASDFAENYFYIAQRAGELEHAERIIDQLIQGKNVKSKNKANWIFQKAFLFYQNGKYESAHKLVESQLKNHPYKTRNKKNKDYEQLAWLKAWLLYLQGKYTPALTAFKEMQSYTTDPNRMLYWTGMSYLNLGEEMSAYQVFKKVAQPILDGKSYSYYNLMGWIRYSDIKKRNGNNELIQILYALTKNKNSVFPTISEDYNQTKMLDLYVQILDEPVNLAEEQINVVNTENEVIYSQDNKGIDIETDDELYKHLAWANFLIKEKQEELAKWHLFEIEKNLKGFVKVLKLAEFYHENQFYYRALSMVQHAALVNNESISFASNPMILNSLYPQAYADFVNRQSNRRQIDPYFLWSLMRAETQYKSDAISPVGAVGLMQFMPYTQDKVASLLGEEAKTSDLFDPEVSVRYGAAYIKKLAIEFDQQIPLMAAAYNGGPHRVKTWLKKLGSLDYDAFIEHIPFAETRTYVKRVLTFHSIYEKIYKKQVKEDELKYLLKAIPYKAPEVSPLKEEWDPYRKAVQKTN